MKALHGFPVGYLVFAKWVLLRSNAQIGSAGLDFRKWF